MDEGALKRGPKSSDDFKGRTFPQKVYLLLERTEEYGQVVEWHGENQFYVKDMAALSKTLSQKVDTTQSEFRKHGFTMHQPPSGACHDWYLWGHPMFIRGGSEMVKQIKRKAKKVDPPVASAPPVAFVAPTSAATTSSAQQLSPQSSATAVQPMTISATGLFQVPICVEALDEKVRIQLISATFLSLPEKSQEVVANWLMASVKSGSSIEPPAKQPQEDVKKPLAPVKPFEKFQSPKYSPKFEFPPSILTGEESNSSCVQVPKEWSEIKDWKWSPFRSLSQTGYQSSPFRSFTQLDYEASCLPSS